MFLKDHIPPSWKNILKNEFDKIYFRNLNSFLRKEFANFAVFPEKKNIFRAFHLTPFENVKTVILGQDPYHGKGQAHGLAFSVPKNIPHPPSLRNVFKELQSDTACIKPKSGDLSKWASEGVLLLNTVLTVREKSPNSHAGKGWEIFTDRVIESLNRKKERVVYILWGKKACEKTDLIKNPAHHIIKAPHPSPFSAYRGFFGSCPFSSANKALKEKNIAQINWTAVTAAVNTKNEKNIIQYEFAF